MQRFQRRNRRVGPDGTGVHIVDAESAVPGVDVQRVGAQGHVVEVEGVAGGQVVEEVAVLPVEHGHAGRVPADGVVKFAQHGAGHVADQIHELILALVGPEAGNARVEIGDKAAPLLAGGRVQQGSGLQARAVRVVGVDLHPVGGGQRVVDPGGKAVQQAVEVLVDHGAVLFLDLNGSILVEVVVLFIGRSIAGGIEAKGQPVARHKAGVGVFGHGVLGARSKIQHPHVTRCMVVQGRIGEAGGGGQNEHAAGKADIVFAVKGVERLTRPVEDAAAPPGGGVRVRPGADEPVRLAGLAVGQQIGRFAGRGLVHHLVAAEDGVPAKGVIAGEEPQPAVPQGRGVVFGRFLLLLGVGHGPGWRGQQRTGGEHPRRQCQARRRAADAE